jgi:hypothetical protein
MSDIAGRAMYDVTSGHLLKVALVARGWAYKKVWLEVGNNLKRI